MLVILSAAFLLIYRGIPWWQTGQMAAAAGAGSDDFGAQTDPLLVPLPDSADGFHLVAGHWEFPGLIWSIAESEVDRTPAEVLAECDLSVLASQATVASQPLDQQLLELVRGVMEPCVRTAEWIRYSVDQTALRGTAECCIIAGVERPVAICVQWPAGEGRWSQLLLTRSAAAGTLQLLTELPDDCRLLSQRRSAGGRVQCQAVRTGLTADELQAWLSGDGWQIRTQGAAPEIFRAERGDRLLEFACRRTFAGTATVLIRELDFCEGAE